MNVSTTALETPTEIRSFRQRMGLKQGALADLLGVDQATVSRWERGQSPIGQAALGKLQRTNMISRPFAQTDLENVWPALLKFYRSARGISQEQLANLLNCSAHSVSRWECGKHKPDLGAQIRLRELILSPLECDNQVRGLVDRIKASRSRTCIHWGPIPLAWSTPLQNMNNQSGRHTPMHTDVAKMHTGKCLEWWSEACKIGFSEGKVPLAIGYWKLSRTDTRKLMAFPTGTYEGIAIWVAVYRPFDLESAGRSNGEFSFGLRTH